jgi:hypothetical protein
MQFTRPFKTFCALFMSFLMTNLPAVAATQHNADHKMISTTSVVADLSRSAEQQKVQDLLSRSDIQKALIEKGVSPEEASYRLANLSDQELRQLSGQIDQARAGGTILVEILLIVLIIFLIKRL